jgi:hypothetical protein
MLQVKAVVGAVLLFRLPSSQPRSWSGHEFELQEMRSRPRHVPFFSLAFVDTSTGYLEDEKCLFIATNTDSTLPNARLLPGA